MCTDKGEYIIKADARLKYGDMGFWKKKKSAVCRLWKKEYNYGWTFTLKKIVAKKLGNEQPLLDFWQTIIKKNLTAFLLFKELEQLGYKLWLAFNCIPVE